MNNKTTFIHLNGVLSYTRCDTVCTSLSCQHTRTYTALVFFWWALRSRMHPGHTKWILVFIYTNNVHRVVTTTVGKKSHGIFFLKSTTHRRKPSKNIDLSLFNRFDSVLTFKFFNYSTMMNDDYKTSQQISNWNFHVKVTTIDYNLILMPYVQISNFKIFGIFTRISSAYNCCKLLLNRLRKSV